MLGYYFNPMYFLFLSPAILLGMWAQWRVKSAYGRGMQMPAGLSGAAAARYILDEAGLQVRHYADGAVRITVGARPSTRAVLAAVTVGR